MKVKTRIKLSTGQLFLLNGIVLLLIGCAGFIANDFVFHTGLTPILSGIVFVVLSFLLNWNRHLISKTGMILALILTLAFIWPLLRNLGQKDYWGILRIACEMTACLVTSLWVYKNLQTDEPF